MKNIKEIILPDGWVIDKVENGKIILKEDDNKPVIKWNNEKNGVEVKADGYHFIVASMPSNILSDWDSAKIICEKWGDLTEDLKQDTHFCNVPLTVTVDTTDIVDDESFNQLEFLEMVHKSANEPKSSCPSPQLFLQEIDCNAKNIFGGDQIEGCFKSKSDQRRRYSRKHRANFPADRSACQHFNGGNACGRHQIPKGKGI